MLNSTVPDSVTIERKRNSVVACPACDFTAKRESAAVKHCLSAHSAQPADLYVKHVLSLDTRPLCSCGCGSAAPWHDLRHGFKKWVVGHNGRLAAHPDGEAIKKKRNAALRKHYETTDGWAKGLTRETDERIAARGAATSAGLKLAYAENRIRAWSAGLSKSTDERVAKAAASSAAAFASGEREPWAKGLTKETDQRIAAMAVKVSETHRSAALREALDSQKRRPKNEVKSLIESAGQLEIIDGLDAYTNEGKSEITVRCRAAAHVFKRTAIALYDGECRECFPSGSAAQIQVFRFTRGLARDAVQCDRKTLSGMELDVLVQSANFAVELNGLYWHSEHKKSPDYHAKKSEACSKLGITLLHVFDDEWRDKRAIVESMIAHRLKKTATRVFARECEITDVDVAERQTFFEKCHLDGDTRADLSFGLRHRELGLVAVMSLRRPFHKSAATDSVEIARWATALNTRVIGGVSKLTSVAKRVARDGFGAKKLMTYCDTRHGDGAGYRVAGFEMKRVTPPRFWWTDGKSRLNRFAVRADKSAGVTEKRAAELAGVARVYGCSNLVFEMNL